MKRVLCVGECMVELRHIDARTLRLDFAGDTYNTAAYLRRVAAELGTQLEVGYLTGLGHDDYSAAMRQAWRDEGIADRSVSVPDRVPGLYAIHTAPDGERRFTYWREDSAARYLFGGSDWCDGLDGDLVHLSGITLQLTSVRSRKALVTRLAELRRAGAWVSFDTNYRATGWSSPREAANAMADICGVANIVLASRDDETQLRGAPRRTGTGAGGGPRQRRSRRRHPTPRRDHAARTAAGRPRPAVAGAMQPRTSVKTRRTPLMHATLPMVAALATVEKTTRAVEAYRKRSTAAGPAVPRPEVVPSSRNHRSAWEVK
jgi:sugar/nucleoside kinase (ribokinase family)